MIYDDDVLRLSTEPPNPFVGRLDKIDHTCTMQYRGIRENHGKPYELFVCEVCGREDWRPYTGTMETLEVRE